MDPPTTALVPVKMASPPQIMSQQWIDDYTMSLFELCEIYFVIPIGSFGTVSNIVNLGVFFSQGLKDMVNLKFASLAVVDLFLTLSSLMLVLCRLLQVVNGEAMLISENAAAYVFAWPRVPLTRAGACITVLITTERCLCIILPLKVKLICTRQVAILVLTFIFLLFLLIFVPIYIPISLEVAHRGNRSILDVIIPPEAALYNEIALQPNVAIQIIAYILMVFATIFLIEGLKRQNTKRRAILGASKSPEDIDASSAKQDDRQSLRDLKIMKMVVLIACLFVCCTLPEIVMLLLEVTNADISIMGAQSNAFKSGWAVARVFTCLNSSVNIFVYFSLNSAFRETLRSRLRC